MKFSIIIPTHNTERYINRCLSSLTAQAAGGFEKEVILIDDCSTDNTFNILQKFRDQNKEWVKLLRNDKNLGPGLTRNKGIDSATGEWLVFLDSDDSLRDKALIELSKYIGGSSDLFDIVGYNWEFDRDSNIKSEIYGGRWDLNTLLKVKDELLNEYVSLGMDGSIIYTAVKKSLLDANKLRFREGLHEDVDFLFNVYFYANKRGVLNLPLYAKNNRESSIVNSISIRHIEGFFRALREMFLLIDSKKMFTGKIKESFYRGLFRVVSSEIRSIWQAKIQVSEANKLYSALHNEYNALLKLCDLPVSFELHSFAPKYIMIANYFLNVMANDPVDIAKVMTEYLDGINGKSWSCYDLHNSVFLTPDEIRTCCKRFFVNNEMKGDVALLNEMKYELQAFTPENILNEKRNLHVRINRGIANECDGCPYLAFKNWGPIDELRIEYISFEYNTVCNMRCSYCSEKYYGGNKPKYDVESLLRQLFEKGSLRSCRTFMWGGGEPTLDSSFSRHITFMTSQYPKVRQRVFTNSTVYSDVVNKLLQEDKILTITSIDAGNEDTFYKIRKHKGFYDVLANLKRYASTKAENMLIKYILTEHNSSLNELQSFVGCIKKYSLEGCNFQISFDFKEETVDLNSLISAIALFTYLSDVNVRFVFFDDLFWQRMSNELNAHYDEVLNKLKELDLLRAFALPSKYNSVVIWGAGIQAKFLMEKSAFFKNVKIDYFVDNSAEKIGKDFFGYKVLSPEVLLGTDTPVFIVAVQNIPNILHNYYKLGLNESRLIKGLVL